MVISHLDRIVYVNGKFIQGRDAKISIFDRGLLFSDAVYEGFGVLDGIIIDIDVHLSRLKRSLNQLTMPIPMSENEFAEILNQLVLKNDIDEGFLYLHITRGEADRDYVYSADLVQNVFAFTQPTHNDGHEETKLKGVKMISHADLRWKRRDIKTSNLLGQVIAKQAAHDADGYEALMIDDEGFITEGGATSFFIVKGSVIVARPVTNEILHGVTRRAMLKVAEELNLTIDTRKFTVDDALKADEAFLTGASSYIEPVVKIDSQAIGSGMPGPVALALRAEYLKQVRI